MFARLSVKLTALLGVVVVAGSALTLASVTHLTRHQFLAYVRQSDRLRAQELSVVFAGFYEEQGSFEGVQELLRPTPSSDGGTMMHETHAMQGMHGPMGRMLFHSAVPERLLLADREGRAIVDTTPSPELVDGIRGDREHGVPVVIGGEAAAWLWVGSMIDSSFSPLQAQFLQSLRLAVVLSALVVALVAMVLGSVFLSGVTRPLRELTVAAHTIASGSLSVAIPEGGRDEVGTLAEGFRTMRAALEDSQSQRERVFRDIAHELRTPVTLLRGEIEAMLDGVYEISAESVRSLHEEIGILDRLVSDIRSISTMDGADFLLVREPTDIAALVDRISAAFQKEAAAKGIEIETQFSGPLPAVAADRGRLSQVFANLVLNALRHSLTASRIMLSAEPYGPGPDGVEVRVSDNGRGIPEEHLGHVFDRFYRIHPARSRATGGSGLGLAIARQIVEAHGGSITAAGNPEGGLQVAVRLPVGPSGPSTDSGGA